MCFASICFCYPIAGLRQAKSKLLIANQYDFVVPSFIASSMTILAIATILYPCIFYRTAFVDPRSLRVSIEIEVAILHS